MRHLSLLLLILFSALSVTAQTNKPILISQPTSTRAVAFESPSFRTEPFSPVSPVAWNVDPRTRVMLFTQNLALASGEDLSAITADAEDGQHRLYSLKVEHLSAIPGHEWLSVIILRLSDDLADVGDVLVRVTYRGLSSNRVRIGIGRVGGGLTDDPGSAPTPAPPYIISGLVTERGVGLSGVLLTLSGMQNSTTTTDSNGAYSFIVNRFGSYSVTPSSPFYSFSPQSFVIDFLTGNKTIDFNRVPDFRLTGRVTDENDNGLAGISVALAGVESGVSQTAADGTYSFTVHTRGNYTLTPAGNSIFAFSPQAISNLTSDLKVNFPATRRTYSISGQIQNTNSEPFANFPVTLSGNFTTRTVTTNEQGFFSFTGVKAGFDHTLTSASNIYVFSPQGIPNLSSDAQINIQVTRRRYTISGRLIDEDSASIVNFPVTLSRNSMTQTVTTNYQGAFTFPDLEAGHDYDIVPVSDNIFAFTRSAQNLSSDVSFLIQPARRVYEIRGRVVEGAKPVGGATVNLSGWTTASATTAADGSYLFPNLQAGRGYTVSAAKTYFQIDPPGRSIENLSNDQEFNFHGTPTYRLTGRVTDERGNGLAGMTITLSGAESAVSQTAGDGSYSFTVHSTGNYALVPSADQNFFTFSPAAQTLIAVNGDRSINFAGALSLATDQAYVIEFDGTPKTVDCGLFWPDDRPLGHFFWEVWGQPGAEAGSTYMISDGYGGAHAILFGFGQYNIFAGGRYQLFGDFWDGGADNVYFGGDDGPAIGEWGHLAVGWDGRQIITYFNGVPVGRVPYSGERWSPGPSGGGGKLLIGGSDHNNMTGRIAQVRGYEDANPREATSVTAAFAPEALFSREGNYLGYFFRPSPVIADMSNYYRGRAHRGEPRGTALPYGVPFRCPDCPPPQFVIDPTAPRFLENSPVNTSAPVAFPAPAPLDALIFDSFSRANSTYTLGEGGLGSTEGGISGAQEWRILQNTGRKPFGILNGRAVLLANEPTMAWVQTGSLNGNVSVRVERNPGPWGSGLDTGIAFRVRDNQHFFFATTSGGENDPADSRKLTLGYYLNGVRTDLATNINMPGHWTRLEVITNSNGHITVLTDLGLVYSINSPILANATGAGLYNSGPGRALLNRWDNFTVYNVP